MVKKLKDYVSAYLIGESSCVEGAEMIVSAFFKGYLHVSDLTGLV